MNAQGWFVVSYIAVCVALYYGLMVIAVTHPSAERLHLQLTYAVLVVLCSAAIVRLLEFLGILGHFGISLGWFAVDWSKGR